MGSDRTGRIILLNGTSSSGKTSLVRALQDRLPDPWLELGIDRFVFALPRRYLNQPGWSDVFRYVRQDGSAGGPFTIETGPLGRRLVGGMHRTAAALAEVGIDVIVDHVLLERAWLDECRRLWAPFPVLFVGVRCPLDVVLRRERERQDRTIGQAEAQSAWSISGAVMTSRSTPRSSRRMRRRPSSVWPSWPGSRTNRSASWKTDAGGYVPTSSRRSIRPSWL